MRVFATEIKDLTTVAGYECPKSTSTPTRKILRKLKKEGVVVFEHDDGEGLWTRDELIEIAGAIGLPYHLEPYRLTLFDEEFWNQKVIRSY